MSTDSAAGDTSAMAASMEAVRRSSKSVSTTNDDAPSCPTTSPALLQPHDPSGCSHAHTPSPTSCNPRSYATARSCQHDGTVRVAQICPYSLTPPGGVQGQVLGLARSLRELGHP